MEAKATTDKVIFCRVMDNLDDLSKRFDVIHDEARFAAGWQYRCRKCGKIPDIVIEGTLPCQGNTIFPEVVKCVGCGNRWKLQIRKEWALTDPAKIVPAK